MGVFTYETEFSSAILAPRLFKAFILDGDNLIPKIAPQAIKSTEIVEGDGGVETIKKITFGEGSQYGSIIKTTSHCHTKGSVEIKEEHVKAGKEKASGLFKLLETYLVANPNAYN
ncbi:hypothetical protein C1H46_003750 [Malus baccata]|uniref:Major allergen Mal d 1 n=1 Tax=Malus baccata TaxID=106549 RepID=A0A540NHW2_MALBA|nr:hypothetical protein C1H46_003750 [Malus baccata]